MTVKQCIHCGAEIDESFPYCECGRTIYAPLNRMTQKPDQQGHLHKMKKNKDKELLLKAKTSLAKLLRHQDLLAIQRGAETVDFELESVIQNSYELLKEIESSLEA